jgi:hypothetical protein
MLANRETFNNLPMFEKDLSLRASRQHSEVKVLEILLVHTITLLRIGATKRMVF